MKNEKKPRNFWSTGEIRCMLDLIKGTWWLKNENYFHSSQLGNRDQNRATCKIQNIYFQTYKRKLAQQLRLIIFSCKSRMKWRDEDSAQRMPSRFEGSGFK